MAAKQTDQVKQLTYLAGALKAPRILEAADRLAEQARSACWFFEDYLAALLEREVSASNASGSLVCPTPTDKADSRRSSPGYDATR